MIKQILDDASVGHYAAAANVSGAFYFISMAITMSLYPAVVSAKKQGKQYYYWRIQHFYDFMFWMAFLIALPTSVFAKELISLLFGESYDRAAPVLAIHIWASLFFALMVASEKWFLSENLTKQLFHRTLAGAVLNVALNLLLIPRYDIQGAAISTFFSQFTVGYLYDALNKKTRISFVMKTKSVLPLHWIRGSHVSLPV